MDRSVSSETEGFLAAQGAVSRARVSRRALTPPEARLWLRLKGRSLYGLKFRRQHPIGSYVLDFYCAEAKLAVEVDGLSHGGQEQSEHDRRRTAWLGEEGVSVLRSVAEDVRINLDGVLDRIAEACRERIRG